MESYLFNKFVAGGIGAVALGGGVTIFGLLSGAPFSLARSTHVEEKLVDLGGSAVDRLFRISNLVSFDNHQTVNRFIEIRGLMSSMMEQLRSPSLKGDVMDHIGQILCLSVAHTDLNLEISSFVTVLETNIGRNTMVYNGYLMGLLSENHFRQIDSVLQQSKQLRRNLVEFQRRMANEYERQKRLRRPENSLLVIAKGIEAINKIILQTETRTLNYRKLIMELNGLRPVERQ